MPPKKLRKKLERKAEKPEMMDFEPSLEPLEIEPRVHERILNMARSLMGPSAEGHEELLNAAENEELDSMDGRDYRLGDKRVLAEHEAEMKGERALVAPEMGGIGGGAILKLLLVIVAIFLILGVFGII